MLGLGKVTLADLNSSSKTSVALAPALVKETFMGSGKNGAVALQRGPSCLPALAP